MSVIFERNNLTYLFLALFMAVLPWSIAAMQIAAGTVVLVILIGSIRQKRFPLAFHPFYYFVLFYLLTQLISVLNSPDRASSFQSVFSTDWFWLFVPFLASLGLPATWKKRVLHTLLISASLAALYGIFQFFMGIEIFRGSRIPAMGHFFRAIGGYNFYLTFAGNQMMVMAIAFSFWMLEKENRRNRYLYGIITSLLFLSVVATFGRSTWIGSLVIFLGGTFLLNRKLFIRLTIAILIIGAVFFAGVPEIRARLLSIFEPSQNEARLNIWRTAWAMFKDHPIFGIGSGRFNQLFPVYKVPGFYDATGHAHNDYLNMAVNSGVIGLWGWLSMWGAWFYYTIRTLREKTRLSLLDRQILYGSLLAITGIMIAAFFQCYYTDLENNILWLTIAAFSLMIQNQYRGADARSGPSIH